MFLFGNGAFIMFMLVCSSFADESSELREPRLEFGTGINEDSKTGFGTGISDDSKTGFGTGFNEDSKTTFGTSGDQNAASNSGGFGPSDNPGQSDRRFGREVFDTPDKMKIRTLLVDMKKFQLRATAEERASSPYDYTCIFCNDLTVYTHDYCNTLIGVFHSALEEFVFVLAIRTVDVTGDTATAHVYSILVDMKKFQLLATAEDRASSPYDFTCIFGNDLTVYTHDYCNTLSGVLNSALEEFVFVTAIRKVDVTGDTATAHVYIRAAGKVPLLGFDVDVESYNQAILVRQADDEWKVSQLKVDVGESSDGIVGQVRTKLQETLRNSIYSSKQNYPAYNPLVIVGGSTVAGCLAIVLFGVWILKKRRSYKNVMTVDQV